MTKSILLSVDLEHPDSARLALREALALAGYREAELHVCYVLPYGHYSYIQPLISQQVLEDTAERGRKELAALVEGEDTKSLSPQIHILRGGISEQVLLLADSLGAGLIIVNARRADMEGYGSGPNAAQIGRYAKCSVMTLR